MNLLEKLYGLFKTEMADPRVKQGPPGPPQERMWAVTNSDGSIKQIPTSEFIKRQGGVVQPNPKPTKAPTATPTKAPTKAPTRSPQVLGAQSPSPTPMQQYMGSIQGRTQKYQSANTPNTRPFQEAIISAAGEDKILAQLMLDIAAQESMLGSIERTSGYHPTQRSASGLFQYVAPTWEGGVKKYGDKIGLSPITAPRYSNDWVSQIDAGRLDPKMNALMTALFLKDGGLRNWDASRDIWGSAYTSDELARYMR